MATATIDRRYTLTMTHDEAQTLFTVLGAVYLTGKAGDKYEQAGADIVHLHDELAKLPGLDNQQQLPLAAGD